MWCHTILTCICSPLVLHGYRITLCVLCFWHPLKKKIHQNKVITQTSCFGFFQKPLVVQSMCLLTSRKRFHKAVLWYRNAHYAQRSWHSSEKHERKRLFLRTKDEQLSWALCLTEYGSSLYAKLEHYTNLHDRLRLYFVHSAFILHFFSFLVYNSPMSLKLAKERLPVPPNTLSVKGLRCCCCIFPQ